MDETEKLIELVTGEVSVDEAKKFLKAFELFLEDKGIKAVVFDFGYIPEMEDRGITTNLNTEVSVGNILEKFQDSLDLGRIEWLGVSDFVIRISELGLFIEICNDALIHVYSREEETVKEMRGVIERFGINIHSVVPSRKSFKALDDNLSFKIVNSHTSILWTSIIIGTVAGLITWLLFD